MYRLFLIVLIIFCMIGFSRQHKVVQLGGYFYQPIPLSPVHAIYDPIPEVAYETTLDMPNQRHQRLLGDYFSVPYQQRISFCAPEQKCDKPKQLGGSCSLTDAYYKQPFRRYQSKQHCLC